MNARKDVGSKGRRGESPHKSRTTLARRIWMAIVGRGEKDVLSYLGGGRVSVSVGSVLSSEKVQRQMAAVKQLEAARR